MSSNISTATAVAPSVPSADTIRPPSEYVTRLPGESDAAYRVRLAQTAEAQAKADMAHEAANGRAIVAVTRPAPTPTLSASDVPTSTETRRRAPRAAEAGTADRRIALEASNGAGTYQIGSDGAISLTLHPVKRGAGVTYTPKSGRYAGQAHETLLGATANLPGGIQVRVSIVQMPSGFEPRAKPGTKAPTTAPSQSDALKALGLSADTLASLKALIALVGK